jgi:very-short-patch-repair endonuclease
MSNSFNQRLHLNASGKLYQFARDLRKAQTLPEDILWQYLRGRKLDGLKFRRQHPLVEYVADFYCHEKRLVIELDGSVHDSRINVDYDNARTNWLAELEVTVVRFRNEEVIYKMEFVIDEIRNTIKTISSLGG